MPGDALPPSHNIVVRTEHCVQRTLPVRTVLIWGHNCSLDTGGGGKSLCGAARSRQVYIFYKKIYTTYFRKEHTHAGSTPLCNSYALVQATAGGGTVLMWYLI